ncbi:MAG: hypothetical protein EBV34_21490 [Betaproteobacteria bacterium]|nr:hypothetical protein [Betaproteobacteria bacterium]
MFELGGHGDLLPVEVEKNTEKVNLVAYGVMESPGVVKVTLINREYGSKGRAAEVEIEVGKAVEKAETITMSQRDGDIAQVGGVTVGGEEIKEDGKWAGAWRSLGQGVNGTTATVSVPSASAVVLRFVLK